VGRQGVRAPWTAIPVGVRNQIDDIARAAVGSATNLSGGFSPGPAARCELADGRCVFVKAGGTELNPDTPTMHRREAAVLTALPANHPSPFLIGVADDGDWVALVIEWIDGRMPTPPLDRADVDRLLALVDRMAVEGDGLHPPGVTAFAERNNDLFGHWRRLVDDPAGKLDRLDDWSCDHLDLLVALDAQAPAASAGDHLLHVDTRTDNVLFSDLGPEHDVVVDWPGASIGAAWIDLVGLLSALHLDGGPPPAEAFGTHPLGRAADPDATTAVLAGFAGYLTRHSLLPPPPGLPTLRAFQAAQGVVARDWLAQRI
jgi:aminoglycoside phosphotransferase (APT) family kinase protein